jgi:hypothetical protein
MTHRSPADGLVRTDVESSRAAQSATRNVVPGRRLPNATTPGSGAVAALACPARLRLTGDALASPAPGRRTLGPCWDLRVRRPNYGLNIQRQDRVFGRTVSVREVARYTRYPTDEGGLC